MINKVFKFIFNLKDFIAFIFSNIKTYHIFCSKYYPLYLVFSVLVFFFIKWPDLSLPIWGDEMSYLPVSLWDMNLAFFLPWNYDPEWFMGHPLLHPLILYTFFSVFAPDVFIARVASLFLSLFFLMTFYKMTKSIFQDSFTTFYTVIFTMFFPLFFIQSSLILADISAMAFGFGSIYAFTERKYKTLLLFSLGMGLIRESSLAFFVPLVLYALAVPSHRKSLLYLAPGGLTFFLHFFIFFLKTGKWLAHPYISGTLTHNPNPEFFNFSVIPHNIRNHFLPLILNNFSFGFLILFAGSITGALIMICIGKKISLSFKKEILIPLGMCVLWFSFWIMYPDQLGRAYFPLLCFLIPLGTHFILKTVPYSKMILILIFTFLFIQTIDINSSNSVNWFQTDGYSRYNILRTKSFVSYLDEIHGHKLRDSKKKFFIPYVETVFLRAPQYGYIKEPYKMDVNLSFCQLNKKEEIKKYGVIVFREDWGCEIPYEIIKNSDAHLQVNTPFENYQLFFHKDLLLNE